MKVLVTGGLGYIGSHTVTELIHEGFDVVVVDNLSNAELTVLDGITAITGKRPVFEQFDIRDKAQVQLLFEKHPDIESVIHFAAFKAVGESAGEPLKYYENNIGGLVNLLSELEKKNSCSFIFSSSCTVYGQAQTMPITEEAPILPALSPYGRTKQMGEEIIWDMARIGKITAVLLRYFNPIGAHPTGLIGELPIGTPQNLVPYITQTAARIRTELSVFGDDYPTPDGTCIRDYIHVMDLAKAHVVALKRLIDQKHLEPVEVFNIGTGRGYSVLEVIRAFEQVNEIPVPYRITGRRDGDITEAYACTKKANKVLGWRAVYSLEEALKSAWNWQKKNLEASSEIV